MCLLCHFKEQVSRTTNHRESSVQLLKLCIVASAEKRKAFRIGNKGRNSASAVFWECITQELAAMLNSSQHCSQEQHPGSVDHASLSCTYKYFRRDYVK